MSTWRRKCQKQHSYRDICLILCFSKIFFERSFGLLWSTSWYSIKPILKGPSFDNLAIWPIENTKYLQKNPISFSLHVHFHFLFHFMFTITFFSTPCSLEPMSAADKWLVPHFLARRLFLCPLIESTACTSFHQHHISSALSSAS